MSDSKREMGSPRVVAVGEVLWDLLPGGAQIGGTSANFVCHARELAETVALASAVGDDDLGREILRRMASRGVETSGVAVLPEKQTGIVEVTVDGAGMPTYRIVEDVAWDHIPWNETVAGLASTADVVCWGTLAQRSTGSRSTVLRFLDQVGSETLKVFDINLRVPDPDRGMVEESLRRADVVKLNDEELPRVVELCGLVANGVPEQLAELSERFGIRVLALTRGGAGSVLWSAGQVSDHPGYPVSVVDTVGAGDAFTAELAIGLWSGLGLDVVNGRANRRAAAVCAHAGGTPPLGANPLV